MNCTKQGRPYLNVVNDIMNDGKEVLKIEPSYVSFTMRAGEVNSAPTGESSRIISLTGDSSLSFIAFKIQTNASKRFNVQPTHGYLKNGESVHIKFQWRQDAGWGNSDKFLVKAVEVQNNSIPIHEFWTLSNHSVVHKFPVGCEYQIVPAESPPIDALDVLENQYRDLLMKNLSILPDDALTVAELKELQQLKSQVGNDGWNKLQERILPVKRPVTCEKKSGLPIHDLLLSGVNNLQAGLVKNALDNYLEALRISKEGSIDRAKTLVGLGSVFETSGLLDKAINSYILALNLYCDHGDVKCQDSLFCTIAGLYNDLRDHEMSAAWNNERLGLLSSRTQDSSKRIEIQGDIHYQKKLGKVSESEFQRAQRKVAQARKSTPRDVSTIRVVDEDKKPISALWQPFSSHSPVSVEATTKPALTVNTSVKSKYRNPTKASLYGSTTKAVNRIESTSPISIVPRDTRANPQFEARQKASMDLHIRRSLDARRLKHQAQGIVPPNVEASDGDESVVYLDVFSHVDSNHYSIALQGPLSRARSMSIRDMRERISFVTGIDLADFELFSGPGRLVDSWHGSDVGLGACTKMELRLLPAVRPQKYQSPSHATGGNDFFSPRNTPPRRPPPIPMDEEEEEDPVHNDSDTDDDLATCIESSLQAFSRYEAQADDLGLKVASLLRGPHTDDIVNQFNLELENKVDYLETMLAQAEQEKARMGQELEAMKRILLNSAEMPVEMSTIDFDCDSIVILKPANKEQLHSFYDESNGKLVLTDSSNESRTFEIGKCKKVFPDAAKVIEASFLSDYVNNVLNPVTLNEAASFSCITDCAELFFPGRSSDSLLLDMVRRFFARLPKASRKSVSVQAVSLSTENTTRDMLDPKNGSSLPLNLDKQLLEIEGSVCVVTPTFRDFLKLFDILNSRNIPNKNFDDHLMVLKSNKITLYFIHTRNGFDSLNEDARKVSSFIKSSQGSKMVLLQIDKGDSFENAISQTRKCISNM